MKMNMNIEIISREAIKPSTPTPPHLNTYNLSLFDQLAPPIYAPIILFYSATDDISSQKSVHLKNSLSKTLTKFYPFAGRIKDAFCIDCNDLGATFIEARVNCDMSIVLKQPEIDSLQQLLPCNLDEQEQPHEQSTEVLLLVQVNYFGCGGMAIGVCIKHVIADVSALANFVKNWAAIASDNKVIDEVIFDCTSLFPPQNVSGFSKVINKNRAMLLNAVMKRFLFDGSKIEALREKVGKIGSNWNLPTRVEAVSALIWGAVMAIGGGRDDSGNIPMYVATTAVNLRKRMNPPLPHQCIGNIYQVTMANCVMDDKRINYNGLAAKIHESIWKMNDEYVRKLHEGGGYLNFMRNAAEEVGKRSRVEVFGFSSWCRFPFYEADFGWGKPIWLSTALKLNKVAIFLDTSDGKGIEAWIGLSKEDMEEFEQDPGILSYASLNPSI